jgi:hypothetical protein
MSGSGNTTRRCPPDGWRRGAVSRGSACLEELLDGFRGILQCDCYSAYGKRCGSASGNHAGRLWAHARGKFHKALQTRQTLAAGPLKDLRQARASNCR